ncbi:hypothetical protein GALL_71590 [mine drainage metagenome]|uniref:Helix-turn-helix domain protein n=1 Tax=mine drainage metagenome TaxID=410659 RepID=A0A1J5TB29_9ZZZZ
MSIDALNWAFNVQLDSAGQKLVLLTLANYADDDGQAFPSQKTLAEKTCMSERAIRDNLTRLEECELVARVPRVRSNGSYTTDLFKLNIGAKPAKKESETQRQNLPTAESADGKIFQTQRQILPNPAADSAGPEPSLNTTITKNNLNSESTREKDELAELDVPEELAAQWIEIRNEVTERMSIAEVLAESRLAGLSMSQVVEVCIARRWSSFKASWYAKLGGNTMPRNAHGPPKPSTGIDWRDSTDGVLKRGMELGIEQAEGESDGVFRNRVIDADWREQQKKAAEFLNLSKAMIGKGRTHEADR